MLDVTYAKRWANQRSSITILLTMSESDSSYGDTPAAAAPRKARAALDSDSDSSFGDTRPAALRAKARNDSVNSDLTSDDDVDPLSPVAASPSVFGAVGSAGASLFGTVGGVVVGVGSLAGAVASAAIPSAPRAETAAAVQDDNDDSLSDSSFGDAPTKPLQLSEWDDDGHGDGLAKPRQQSEWDDGDDASGGYNYDSDDDSVFGARGGEGSGDGAARAAPASSKQQAGTKGDGDDSEGSEGELEGGRVMIAEAAAAQAARVGAVMTKGAGTPEKVDDEVEKVRRRAHGLLWAVAAGCGRCCWCVGCCGPLPCILWAQRLMALSARE